MTDQVFEALVKAHGETFRSDLVLFPFDERRELQSYRNGLLDAYVLMTGRDPEAVLVDVTETLIARAETV